MNIGAKYEYDYGLYFQWGDTVGYTSEQIGIGTGLKEMNEFDYKFYNKNGMANSEWLKYNKIDKKITLESEDDAATVNMGPRWKIPTKEQFEELIEGTEAIPITTHNIKGIRFYSNKINDNSKYSKPLFFPFCGYWYGSKAYYGNFTAWADIINFGKYWSSTIDDENDAKTFMLLDEHEEYRYYDGRKIKEPEEISISYEKRVLGLPIRAVLA